MALWRFLFISFTPSFFFFLLGLDFSNSPFLFCFIRDASHPPSFSIYPISSNPGCSLMNLVILWGELGGVYLAGLLFCLAFLDASYTQKLLFGFGV